jgi:hypothetical protein
LRGVEKASAFGAFVGIDGKGIALLLDRFVGAFEFAGTATGAFFGDDFVGHVDFLFAGLLSGFCR